MTQEKNGRRVSILFTAVIEDTETDATAISRAAFALESTGTLKDIRKLSIQVLGLIPNKKSDSPALSPAIAAYAERIESTAEPVPQPEPEQTAQAAVAEASGAPLF
ncbi:MAG TPA: hypothetical protein VND65_01880 [Candidatus Binatia bacterium]|nr:hypothetical protein [Candidatus Binatia bacterium]